MKFSAILREATRNMLSGTTRFVTFAAVLSVLVCGLVVADSIAIRGQILAGQRFRDSGAATLVLEAGGGIDGRACNQLQTIPGVRAAGALRASTRKVTMSALPNAPVPAFDVSPGFADLLFAKGEPTAGLAISDDVATTLGLRAGDVLATTEGAVPVSAIYPYPSDGRRPGFGYAVLAESIDDDPFDECWVASWPQPTNLRGILLTTLMPGAATGDQRPTVSQLNSSLGADFDGSDSYSTRITRGTAPLAFALGLFVGCIAIRIRRLELVCARHSGVSQSDLAALHVLEGAAWSLPALVLAICASTIAAQSVSSDDANSLFMTGLSVAMAGFAGATLGTLVATAATREKHLFRYFKDR